MLNNTQTKVYATGMRTRLLRVVLALLIAATPQFAQLPPATVRPGKPALKRDHTQRVLYPKIIQHEDERTVTNDLVDMLLPTHGGARRRTIRVAIVPMPHGIISSLAPRPAYRGRASGRYAGSREIQGNFR